jgi:hypothetical protein
MGDGGGQSAFRPMTVALLVLIGVIGFSGMLVTEAYAPELGRGSRAGAHALSNAATGYSGLVRLAAETGLDPQILRNQPEWDSVELVVVAPETAATDISEISGARGYELTTLFILPKWQTIPDPDRQGWVRTRGLLPASEPEGVFAPVRNFKISRHEGKVAELVSVDPDLPESLGFVPPTSLQVISDPDGELEPVITDGDGGIVLGKIDNMFILADPDLLNNAAMKRPENAAAALELLGWLNYYSDTPIGFDVVLNGLGGGRSLLRLAFDPPFLAMTLALLAMVLLLGLRAFGRFGPPRLRERAIAFGKAALVDNGAMLVRKAGKTHLLGGRFAAVIRDQAVRAFGVSPRLKPAEVDAYLDRLGGEQSFTELAARAEATNDDSRMLAACRALHAWKQEKLSDH